MALPSQTSDFKKLVSDLKKKFKPDSVLLFGSRVKGSAHKNSDYDLILLFETLEKSRLSIEQDIYQFISGRSLNVDVIVYSSAQFNELKEEYGSLPYEVSQAHLSL